MADLPDNVAAAMFLRDGWPDAIVCKVLMRNGCIGIGIHRRHPLTPSLTPQEFDRLALVNALANVSESPPDYTPLQEHVAKQQRDAEARAAAARRDAIHDAGEEPDHDLQACMGYPPKW